MRLNKYLKTLVTLCLVACSQDDNIPTPQFEEVDIRANIVYGNMTGGFTRSNPTVESESFSNGDVIIVSTTDDQGPTKYTLEENTWKPETDKALKWKQESLTFTAWYPAIEGTSATNFTLPGTFSEDNIAQWDYMTATAENAIRENGVNLTFARKMALVVINKVEVGEVFGNATISKIVLHSNSCGYKNGSVNKEKTTDITMLEIGEMYYAITSPTEENDASTFLTVTLSNNETAIVKGIPALVAGQKYTYELNVGRETMATSVSVSEWTSAPDNPLNLKGGLSYTISSDKSTYTVYRSHGLMAWNAAVQSNKSLNLTLGNNIDMQDVTGWQQVTDYTGTITGNGYTISGLSMEGSNGNAGFIAKLGTNGKIVNMNLAGLTVTGAATNVGGLVGENDGGTIGACSVTSDVTASSATSNVGGLVGLNSSGSIVSSYCTGSVSGSTNAKVGDIAGTNSGTITGCYHGNGLIGVGVGTGNVTKVGTETGMTWVPENDKDNGAMNVMNSKMTDDLKKQLGDKFGWISNNGTDKDSRPLIIGSDARFDVVSAIIKTNGNITTYEVYTADGLARWNTSASTDLDLNLTLMDDIDMSELNWTNLGSYSKEYIGTIEGNGKTLSNFSKEESGGYKGLVSHLGANGVVRNVHLRDINIYEKGANYVGGIVGYCEGTVVGCSVSGYIKSEGYDVAGIVGTNWSGGKIIACYNLAEIKAAGAGTTDNAYGIGGIVGRNYGDIISCYNTGSVTNERVGIYDVKKKPTGAIVGSNQGNAYKVTCSYFGETTLSGIGDGTTGETTEITDDYWQQALEAMNNAITSYGCKYVANIGNETEPLKLVKTGN